MAFLVRREQKEKTDLLVIKFLASRVIKVMVDVLAFQDVMA